MSNKYYDDQYLTTLQTLFTKTKDRSYALLDLKDSEIVADVGCGVGQDADHIAKHCQKVYGIDNDDVFLDLANQKYGRKELQFIKSSADRIPLENASVDKIRYDRILQYIESHEDVLQEANRLLISGGLLQIIDTDYFSLSLLLGNEVLERKIVDTLAYHRFKGAHKIRKLPSLLEKINFSVSQTEIHNYI